jgi:hypothetical protein
LYEPIEFRSEDDLAIFGLDFVGQNDLVGPGECAVERTFGNAIGFQDSGYED